MENILRPLCTRLRNILLSSLPLSRLNFLLVVWLKASIAVRNRLLLTLAPILNAWQNTLSSIPVTSLSANLNVMVVFRTWELVRLR